MELIKTKLNLEETIRFVRNVVNTVFVTDEQGNPTAYNPELYDAALHLETAKAYFGFTESDDLEADYNEFMELDLDMLSNSDLDMTQFYAMESAIYEKIKLYRDILIRKA